MADWIYVVVVIVLIAGVAFAGVTLLLRRTLVGLLGGAALILLGGWLPFFLFYGWFLGVLAAAIGGVVAAVRRRRTFGRLAAALVAAALVVLAGEPLLLLNVAQVQADESYDRCAGDKAVAAIEKSRAEGSGYPTDMRGVAQFDGEYGDACYVNNGVKWLYRVGVPGTYTVGYWVDWRVTRHVCLHTARTQGWTCGFETWGPFKPGEVD